MAADSFRAPEGSIEYDELFNAARVGDIERLESISFSSLDVNALEADRLQGRGAIHMAAQAGNVPAIRFLLAHGAKVDLRNAECETPLHEAAFWAHPAAIQTLLDAGADINLPTGDYNYTALHNVLKYKNTVTPQQIETIKLLLDKGLDVNAEADCWGSTLIDQACALHSLELVQLLIDRGARFDHALSFALNDYAIVKFLLSRGAKIISGPDKESTITNAAGVGNADVLRLLLSHADKTALDGSRDALHWAAAGGRLETVKVLIEHGFNVNTTITDCIVGTVPLLAVCESKRIDPQKMVVAKLLIQSGADINVRNREGKTVAELLVQNTPEGQLREDPELQHLMAAACSQ